MSLEIRRDVFQAIADPNRRQIIDLLANGPMTLNAIADKFNISRPAVSQHIKLLTECGLVEIEQRGRERYCKIQPQNLIPAFLWLEKYHKQWEERIDSFDQYLNILKSKNLKTEKMSKMNDVKSRALTLKKVFSAPIKLVWKAWTNPDHIIQWWAPKGMKINIIEHDFRVGGKWKYSMPMPDGTLFVSEGVYLEIVEFKKIVSSADFKPMTEGVELHVLLEEDGDNTNFTFSVVHATEEYCKQQEKMGFYNGWGSAFNRLETTLTDLNK